VTQFPPAEATRERRDALPIGDVEALLGTFSKALRAFQMYQSNNPVFQRFNEALREEFRSLWSKTDVLEVTVHEEGFGYQGSIFRVGSGRDAMAFAFYKDGIRYLKFLPGFEDEVAAFLDAVRRARLREDDADDMISVLWEEDLGSFQYGYVDLLSEGVALPETPRYAPTDEPGEGVPLVLEGIELIDDGEGGAGGARGLARGDFDETLYFLDPAELERVQSELEQEMGRDLRRDVLHALFDRLQEGDRPDRQAEIMGILDQLLPLFLSRGEMGYAALILEELSELAEASRGSARELAERVERLFARLGDPTVLEQFVRALEEGAVSPASEDVTLFFSRLDAGALPLLVRMAETSASPTVAARLDAAIDGLAARYPAGVDALLSSEDAVLVRGGARAAGRVKLTQAVPSLDAAFKRGDRDVRVAVVGALVSIRSAAALQALVGALKDEDREVRIAAARALGAVRFVAAREPLTHALDERRLKDADLTEKMAFYEAYGAVVGPPAVERLDRLLNHKGFLGRRAPGDLRACAALGLGKIATPAARVSLERSRRDEDPVVRSAVARALGSEGT
jgi:HEAT repeat protein